MVEDDSTALEEDSSADDDIVVVVLLDCCCCSCLSLQEKAVAAINKIKDFLMEFMFLLR